MSKKKPVIVCVDDEQTILKSLKMDLSRVLGDGYLIELAENGEDCLELCAELIADHHEIPVIISDYIMPGMKGDELLRKLHERLPATLKIMLTGQAAVEAIVNAVNQAKLYRYIAKPWEPEDLRLTVKEAVRSYFQEQMLAEQTLRLTEAYQQLEALNRVHERFVPKQFLSLLGKQQITDIELGNQVEKEMSVLFSDIRGFTALSEGMTPQENFNFINDYLGQMEPAIGAHQGFIDKYIGDAIMALFPGSADDAVRAGIAMLHQLGDYNTQREQEKLPPVRIGIGINTGRLMLGMVGGKTRMDGTVIADAVNLASRVENLTKLYEADLLITQHTYRQLSDPSVYKIRVVDHVLVKGKRQAVTVYEVFDADQPTLRALKTDTLDDFKQGFRAYHARDFNTAQKAFQQVVTRNTEDRVARSYLQKCQRMLHLRVLDEATILVIDDSRANRLLLNEVLVHQGLRVLVADNGQQGLEIAQQQLPDLILLDVMMPDLDGFSVCAQLKSNPDTLDIPVVFMTALQDLEQRIQGFDVGAVDYITKPFYCEEVLARIKTHLTLRHLYRELQHRNQELENMQRLRPQTKFPAAFLDTQQFVND